jgi:hypothetical protein
VTSGRLQNMISVHATGTLSEIWHSPHYYPLNTTLNGENLVKNGEYSLAQNL